MKGKKFDAHEKHFQEKELKLRQEIKNNNSWTVEISSINTELIKENKQLKAENDNIKEKYNKLLEYSKMSEEDLQNALKKDKAISQFSGIMGTMGRYL